MQIDNFEMINNINLKDINNKLDKILNLLEDNKIILNKYNLVEEAEQNNIINVKLLLKNGADVNNIKYHDGTTALHHASTNGHIEIVELLLKNGADVNLKCKLGFTAYDVAGTTTIKKLLKNRMNKYNLIDEVKKNNIKNVELLLKNGEYVNNINSKNRKTALHYASKNGHKEIVELLLKYGADVNNKDGNDNTAYEIAKTDEIKNLIKNYKKINEINKQIQKLTEELNQLK